jgi:F0F1-type ATP synthase assembly protein I
MLQNHKKPNNKNASKPTISAFSIATDMLAGVLVGLFLGIYLDKFLQLTPIFTIICSIMGVFASLKMIYDRMK